MTTVEGPPLEALLQRLLQTPIEFVSTDTDVIAVAHDVVSSITSQPCDPASMQEFVQLAQAGDSVRPHLGCALLVLWLLADEWFTAAAVPEANLWYTVKAVPGQLANSATSAIHWTDDPERREELVRTVMATLGCRPAGETDAQAQDRLSAVSLAERRRVIASAAEAEKREGELRAALAAEAARQAADKMTRE
jgi:hypothetical protein